MQKYAPNAGYGLFLFSDIAPNSYYGIYDWWGIPKKGLQAVLESNMPIGVFLKFRDGELEGIYAVLDYLGVAHFETTDSEADDVITAYTAKFSGEVVISSYDSDFFQLISDRVRVFRYKGDCSMLCDSDYVTARYGVGPDMYAEHKCLVGDTADNIIGVKGVGPKTAASLLSRFGSLDALITDCSMIEKEKIRSAISESRDRILLNRELILLNPTANVCLSEAEMLLPDLPYGGAGSILREVGIL